MKMSYSPTPLGRRRKHQHGQARQKRRKQYRANRSKARIQHHIWYMKNKNNPSFKRRQKVRRQHPERFRMRRADEGIAFEIRPDGEIGCVTDINVETGVICFRIGEEGEERTLEAMDFLKSVVFLTPEDATRAFALIDEALGLEAYEEWDIDPTPELAERVASRYLTTIFR